MLGVHDWHMVYLHYPRSASAYCIDIPVPECPRIMAWAILAETYSYFKLLAVACTMKNT